ncbi:hypothetical protein [Spiroplasma sp. SV19]|uniref:hypothetical protein n=1 Tax=Spiroplasma sp. SV19 TaxID=2570468 RepID=UPI0024B7B7C5|nr:hypothetical protein [Spiroplasma sp. SV19]WHQ37497.1 hypothetical protein E7Y35_06600 [Spiroplasma sp. SV19]
MAIIKLKELGEFKGGISSLDKSKYNQGINFVNYMDIFKNFFIDDDTKLSLYNASEKEKYNYNLKYGDAIFTASSETPEEIAMSTIYLSNKMAIFNGFSKRYRFNHKILLPKYAGYFLEVHVLENM